MAPFLPQLLALTLPLIGGEEDTTTRSPAGKESTDKAPADKQKDPASSSEKAPAEPTPRRAIRPEDYQQWESLGFGFELSDDGRWLTYSVRTVGEDSHLHIRDLNDEEAEDVVVEDGRSASFSSDGRWLGYIVQKSSSAGRGGRGGRPGSDDSESSSSSKSKFVLRDLSNGEEETTEDVRSFEFSDDGRFLLLEPSKRSSNTIVVRDLKNDSRISFGNVARHSFNDEGSLLAMVIETDDDLGNGVQLYDAETGALRVLDSSDRKYRAMTWRKDAPDLAVLRDTEHGDDEEGTHVVLSFRKLDQPTADTASFDHRERDTFPTDTRIDGGRLTWSKDGEALIFDTRPWEKKPAPKKDKDSEKKDEDEPESPDDGSTDDESTETDAEEDDDAKAPSDDAETEEGETETEEGQTKEGETDAPKKGPAGKRGRDKESKDGEKGGKGGKGKKDAKKKTLRESLDDPAGVDVWHVKDIDIIPQQQKGRGSDPAKTFAWWIADDRAVALHGEAIDRISFLPGHRHALGIDNTPYEVLKKFGPTLNDIYLVDTKTGESEKIIEGLKYRLDSSPNGRYFIYVRNERLWSYDVHERTHHDLTGSIDDSFIDVDDDGPSDEKSAFGVAAWAEDESRVLLNSEFDVWSVAPDGSDAKRLTHGAKDEIRHRFVDLYDESSGFSGFRFGGSRDSDGVDLSKPMYFSLSGRWTKKSGYARKTGDGEPEVLVYGDKRIGSLQRAEDKDVFAYTEQAYDDSPDLFVTGDFASRRQISKTNTHQKDFLWGRSELIDYTSKNGDRLQGALTYPADYQPGKRYPMIVDIYEIRSTGIHRYQTPSEKSPYNKAVFSAEGYFVYEPDIVYRPRNPGLSAVECVIPAVEAVLRTGMIDPDRIGLVGHSWGAYQTAFLVTQTDLFAAGVAGAPLTDMLSMSMNVYWSTGTPNAWIFHEGQGRMDRPFWRDLDIYVDNSPIFHIDKMETPLLIAFGTEDGAVDWRQGVEMYNAARLAEKQLVMLVYEGEGHGLRKDPNRVDYHYRIKEWFGHYLKGEEAKPWITEGVSHEDRKKELEAMKKGKGRGGPRGPRPGPTSSGR